MSRFVAVLCILCAIFALAYWQIDSSPGPVQEEGFVSLFDGRSLEGWHKVGGESTFEVEGGEIIGLNGPGENTFLRTDALFSDFVLKLQFRWDELGNSGIMFRAKQRPQSERVYGYQMELDHSDRSWSGGLYDEARRGWLYNLEHDEQARGAIKLDDWNDVRIEARGASLKTFINDIPIVDAVDAMDSEGFIALQVHSGGIGKMRWRNIRIKEFPRVTAPGVSLVDDAEWQRRDISDWMVRPEGFSALGTDGHISSRRQFGDAQASFDLSLCENPHRIQFRERSISKRYAELSISRSQAIASVSNDAGVQSFDALPLNDLANASISLVSQGDQIVISVGEKDVLRLAESGLPDRGRIVFKPGKCDEGMQVSGLSWVDLVGGVQEIKFYQTLDTQPAPVLTPEEALADFLLPEGFVVELVAAEPLVADPVAMAWDEYGRLYVVEMRGFMPDAYGTGQEAPVGQIVRLEDTDADGQMDQSEVFLGGLVNPRAVAVVNEGILIGEPPNLWLCELPTKDALCTDKRSLGEYGLAEPGTSIEHLENALMPGLDNWIVNSKSSREFRLQNGELEVRDTNFRGQWGITKDNFGRIFHNHNSNFITADFFAADDLLTTGEISVAAGLSQVLTSPEEVFTARVNPGVNRAYIDNTLREDGRLKNATAVSGLEAYRGNQFPAENRNDVFVAEPGGNVVAQFRLAEDGVALSAEHLLYDDETWGKREFLASTDERFRPVDLHIGPDGALYIIDMYRGIIQEQTFLTEELREQILQRQLDSPIGYGRIWRVRHKEGPSGSVASDLGNASAMELVLALFSPNGWQRDTAQRLLVARPGEETRAIAQVLTGESTLAGIHALWVLEGRGELTREHVLASLAINDARRSQQALRAGRKLLSGEDLLSLNLESSELLAMQSAFALGDHVESEAVRSVLRDRLIEFPDSKYVAQAVVRASSAVSLLFLEELLADKRFSENSTTNVTLLAALTESAYQSIRPDMSATEAAPEELLELLAVIERETDEREWRQLAMLSGLHDISISNGFTPALLSEAPAIFSDGSVSEDSPLWGARLQGRKAFTWPGDEVAAGIKPLSPNQLQLMAKGESFYARCATCHGADGQGIAGLAPSLVNAPWVVGPPEWLGRIILQGMTGPLEINGETWDGVMPAHGMQSDLDDETLAGLMIYLRRSWGHTEDPVSLEQIAELRAATAARSAPWTAEELQTVEIDRGYDRFVGKYKVSFVTMTIFEDGGALNLKVPMYGGGALQQESDLVFAGAAAGETVRLEFVEAENGEINKFIMDRNGDRFGVRRVKD